MLRLRWNMLILTGVLFFMGVAIWLNEMPMSIDNPFNDGLFPFFTIMGLIILLPYYVGPWIMKLKSPTITGPGLSSTLKEIKPFTTVGKIPASLPDGTIIIDEGGCPEYIYPNYNIYNLGGASAFNLTIKGGGWSGIAIFPDELCKEHGRSIQVMIADIEVFRTPDEKKEIPKHVKRKIRNEYLKKSRMWSDEFPIYWGEVPAPMEGVPYNVSNQSERCKMLERKADAWEHIARQYEDEVLKKDNDKEENRSLTQSIFPVKIDRENDDGR